MLVIAHREYTTGLPEGSHLHGGAPHAAPPEAPKCLTLYGTTTQLTSPPTRTKNTSMTLFWHATYHINIISGYPCP